MELIITIVVIVVVVLFLVITAFDEYTPYDNWPYSSVNHGGFGATIIGAIRKYVNILLNGIFPGISGIINNVRRLLGITLVFTAVVFIIGWLLKAFGASDAVLGILLFVAVTAISVFLFQPEAIDDLFELGKKKKEVDWVSPEKLKGVAGRLSYWSSLAEALIEEATLCNDRTAYYAERLGIIEAELHKLRAGGDTDFYSKIRSQVMINLIRTSQSFD